MILSADPPCKGWVLVRLGTVDAANIDRALFAAAFPQRCFPSPEGKRGCDALRRRLDVNWASYLNRAAREPIGASPAWPSSAVERLLGTLPGSASIVTFPRQNGKCQFEPPPGRGFCVVPGF